MDEEIVTVGGWGRACDGDASGRALDARAVEIFAGEEQGEFGSVIHPPVRRVDLVDDGSLSSGKG